MTTHAFPVFWLLHPDEAVRRALCASIETTWNGIQCGQSAADAFPASIPDTCLVIGTEKPDTIPAQRFVQLTEEHGKPQRFSQFLRRIETALRQMNTYLVLHIDDATLDTRNREWRTGDTVTALTEKEVAVLIYLHNAREPATREDLLRDVWAYAPDADTHTIETHIYRLRQKIEKDPTNPRYVMTEKAGYQLAARSIA